MTTSVKCLGVVVLAGVVLCAFAAAPVLAQPLFNAGGGNQGGFGGGLGGFGGGLGGVGAFRMTPTAPANPGLPPAATLTSVNPGLAAQALYNNSLNPAS